MSDRPAQRILVDAAFHAETEHAALACVFEGGEPVARIIHVESSQRAEIRALALALTAAAERGLKGKKVVFVCDCQSVVYGCNGASKTRDRYLKQVRRALLRNPTWRLEWHERKEVTLAHQLAEITYSAWQAGLRSSKYVRYLNKGRRQRLQSQVSKRAKRRRREARLSADASAPAVAEAAATAQS